MKSRGVAWWFWGILAVSALALLLFSLRASQDISVIVEWSTASEFNTAGFNLYRSEQEDGPYEQINEALIPGSTDPLTGGDYEFLDENVSPGVTYYYQLEEVETEGTRNRYDPIQITAEPGGQLELLLAAALFAVVLLGLGLQVFAGRRGAGDPRPGGEISDEV